MSERSCGEQVPWLLRELGVDTVFGLPGVHSLEFYRSLEAAGITHVSARHEQGAGFMADGYARAGRRPGVAMLISGPGVTNAATPLGQAYSDSVPLLLLTAAVAHEDLGMDRGALHDIRDQRALTAPITGLSAMAHVPAQVPHYLALARSRFESMRPRPVHLSIPLDVLTAPAGNADSVPGLPPAPSRPGPDPRAIARLAERLSAACNPLVLAGGGAIGAAARVRELVERTGALFVSTVAGKGILPDSHPLSLGSTLQRLATREAVAEADLVLAIGTEIAEPDLYVTADAEASGEVPAEMLEPRLLIRGEFARIDIDPEVLLRDQYPDPAIVADADLALAALCLALPGDGPAAGGQGERATVIRAANGAALSALERAHQQVLDAVRAALPEDGLIYADMAQIGYTGCITFPVEQPACWHFPMGYGTLGYALPAAIGGQLACPRRAVVVLVGDGGLQFTLQELATAVEQSLPLAIVLWDNAALGEIADFMRARGIPQIGTHPPNPDFTAVARAWGMYHAAPATAADVTHAVANALTADGPTLIHVRQEWFAQ